ncbi:MAG: hypothetical protein AB1714_23565 [Acidobacteriota bacterium]
MSLALTEAYAKSLGMVVRSAVTAPDEITLTLSGAQICFDATGASD